MTDPRHLQSTSNRKPFNHLAGYKASRHNLINNGWVVIYDAELAGMDTYAGRWSTVCELHGHICNTTSLKLARPFLKHPEFCEPCMEQATCPEEPHIWVYEGLTAEYCAQCGINRKGYETAQNSLRQAIRRG